MSNKLLSELRACFQDNPKFIEGHADQNVAVFGNETVEFVYGEIQFMAAYDRGDLLLYLRRNDQYEIVDEAVKKSFWFGRPTYRVVADLPGFLTAVYPKLLKYVARR